MSLKTKIKKDKDYETYITFRKPLSEYDKNRIGKYLKRYELRQMYFISSDKPKHRKSFFIKKSKER